MPMCLRVPESNLEVADYEVVNNRLIIGYKLQVWPFTELGVNVQIVITRSRVRASMPVARAF